MLFVKFNVTFFLINTSKETIFYRKSFQLPKEMTGFFLKINYLLKLGYAKRTELYFGLFNQ